MKMEKEKEKQLGNKRAHKGNQPCQHLDCGMRTLRTLKIFCSLSQSVVCVLIEQS